MICVQEFWRLSSVQDPILGVQVQQLYDIKSFNYSETFQVQTRRSQNQTITIIRVQGVLPFCFLVINNRKLFTQDARKSDPTGWTPPTGS